MISSLSFDDTTLRLQKLIEANQALAQVESLSELLPRLLHLAQEVTHAEASSILLYKEETNTLEFALAYNEQEGTAESIINKKIELKLGEGIAGHVAATRSSIIVENVHQDERFNKNIDKISGFVTKSILCVPVIYNAELLGVVQVLNAKDKDNFDNQDLLILESFSHLGAVALVRSKLLDAMLKQERFQAQLDAAARIQRNFLPRTPKIDDNHVLYAQTKPAIFVGGDFYDVISSKESLLIIVADVSGKGLPAALIGASLWTTFRSLSTEHEHPANLIKALNEEMFDIMAQQLFATLVCCRYWPENGRALISLAGHLPPLIVATDGITEISGLQGPPVGIDENSIFTEQEIHLKENTSLLFMTDGISEARNGRGDFFGDENIISTLSSLPEGVKGPAMINKVEQWRGNVDANDDLTLVEIWRK